jgi:hypothetical protein
LTANESPVTCEESGGILRLGNGLLTLQFDRTTGRWLALTDESDGATLLHNGDLLSPLLLTVGGTTTATRNINQLFAVADAETVGLHWQVESCEFRSEEAGDVSPQRAQRFTEGKQGEAGETSLEGEGGSLVVRLREGDWRAELHYRLRPGRARVERRVRLEYDGDGEVLLRGFTLRMPFASLGPPSDCFLEAPGYPIKTGSRVSHIWHGGWGPLAPSTFGDAPAWRPPFLGMHNPSTPRSLGFWAWTETEPFFPQAERAEQGVLFSHRVYLADRFRRGHALEWGTQYLEVFPTDWHTALARLQDFYDEVGFAVPTDVPEWARSVDMYEVHVGTLSGTKLAPYPTYEPLIADLPRLKAKGFDVIYIMPHVPYPSYSVIDYLDLDIQQGSAGGFKAFVERAHALGLKVFMDVTMHGVMDRRVRREMMGRSSNAYPMEPTMPELHPYLTEHPEWFSRNEAGEIAITYTYAFDHANPSWQEFMAKVFRYYVEAFDVDGFRVDSHTWNFFPNWARDLPYPASRSFYGSAQLFKRIRQELKAIKPEVVLYTETAGPLLHSSHELGYNYDETWLLVSTLPIVSRHGLLCHFLQPSHVTTARMTARDIAHWLTQRRLAMPRGAIKVRHLDCHDTYWVSKEFRRETFGPAAARAIVAFFAFLDGGFMDYNGADEEDEDFYRKVMHLRRALPTLKQGICDYLAVTPTEPMVFAPLWEGNGHYLLPVIHFDNCRTGTDLSLPIEQMNLPAERYRLIDHMAERELTGPNGAVWNRSELAQLRVELDAYGILLLELLPAE